MTETNSNSNALSPNIEFYDFMDGHSVRVKGSSDQPLFNAKDVATILGYANTTQAIRKNVDIEDKTMLVTTDGRQTAMWVNKKGACQLLTKTRKVVSDDVLVFFKKIGIMITKSVRYECKESRTLGYIRDSFPTYYFKFQNKVGQYFMDMYMYDLNIWIECDESGHNDRDPEKEKEREEFIKKTVKGVKLIRYNPDAKDFSIFKVIGEITSRTKCIRKDSFKE